MSIEESVAVRSTLEQTLSMSAARPLAEGLLAARGSHVIIDASKVDYIGAQCAQVLAAAVLTWRSDAVPLELVDLSPAFSEGLRLLGLTSFFKHQEAL